ncbi:MAG: hypothetical protein Q8Q37_02695, partial [bacterium]|nr:hypothetical protein [bacterium]
MFWRYLAVALLIVLAVLTQSTNILVIWGIKPNLLLVVLMTLIALDRRLAEYLTWLLLGVIMLRFEPALSWFQAAIIIIALTAFVLHKFLPWSRHINIASLVIIGTVLFYLLIGPNFIYRHWSLVLGEIIYNLIIASVLIL